VDASLIHMSLFKKKGLYKYDTVLCYLFFSDQEEKNKFLYEKLIFITGLY